MRYRPLGATGIQVSDLSFGAMNLGSWANDDRAAGVRMIHEALEAGINLVDTADVYSRGGSEEIVGEALRGRRDEVVLATKFHMPSGRDPNRRGNSRRWIMQAVDESLSRLQTDHIDLYQVHRPDPSTDIDETLGALTDLVRTGKVRTIGTSTFPAHAIVATREVAERRGREIVRCEQPPYSILARGIERDVLPVCRDLGMGAIVWSPLNAGWLSGRYRRDRPPPEGSRAQKALAGTPQAVQWDPEREAVTRKYTAVERLEAIAAEAGLSLVHLAVAWVREHPAVSSAIVGPRTPDQLRDVLAGTEAQLDEAVLDAIDDVVPPGVNVDHLDAGERGHELRPARRRRSA